MSVIDKILRLINEQNNPYYEVNLDNVVMSKPKPIHESTRLESFSGSSNNTWTVPEKITQLEITLDGAGGGSGGSDTSGACSTKGGDGAREVVNLTVAPGDTITIKLGAGGTEGLRGFMAISGNYQSATAGYAGEASHLYHNGVLVRTAQGGPGSGPSGTNPAANAAPLGGSPGGAGVCPIAGEGQMGNPGTDGAAVIRKGLSNLEDRNTAVTLTGILNQGYRGSADVYYKRNNLSELFKGVNPKFRSRSFTPQGLIDKVNARYGLFLTLDDLDGYSIPTFTDADLETTTPIEMRVKDQNYGWLGTVTVGALYGNPVLETVVLVQLLPVLNHPESLDEIQTRRSGTISTYYFDFTAWKDDLQIDPKTGEWANFARVQEIGRLAGLTYWYNGTVVDLPTSSVPNANPMFERVMVQSTAQGDVLGPIYFHYDVNW